MLNLAYLHISYLGIVVLLILTGFGMPLPEEVVVILAGVASHSHLNPWLAFLSCMVGALCGDCVLYAIGLYFGRSVVREHRWFVRFVTPEREQLVEQMIQRHGLKALVMARFLVGIRSPVFLAAGIMRVPFRKFFIVDVFSATAVIGLFFGLSYVFAEQIMSWLGYIRHAEVGLTVVIAASIVAAVLIYWRRRRQRWSRVLHRRRQRLLGGAGLPNDDAVGSKQGVS